MIYGVYCVRDQLQGFMLPSHQINDQLAIRDFSFYVNKPEGLMYANPNHFDLYKIGEYDTETGKMLPKEPELLVTGLSVIEKD